MDEAPPVHPRRRLILSGDLRWCAQPRIAPAHPCLHGLGAVELRIGQASGHVASPCFLNDRRQHHRPAAVGVVGLHQPRVVIEREGSARACIAKLARAWSKGDLSVLALVVERPRCPRQAAAGRRSAGPAAWLGLRPGRWPPGTSWLGRRAPAAGWASGASVDARVRQQRGAGRLLAPSQQLAQVVGDLPFQQRAVARGQLAPTAAAPSVVGFQVADGRLDLRA